MSFEITILWAFPPFACYPPVFFPHFRGFFSSACLVDIYLLAFFKFYCLAYRRGILSCPSPVSGERGGYGFLSVSLPLPLSVLLTIYCMHGSMFLLLFSFRRQKSGAPHVSQISLYLSVCTSANPRIPSTFHLSFAAFGSGTSLAFQFSLI